LRFGLPRPPALAHRLDADTSGVLVLGRHPKALSKLGRLFSGRDTEKTYWAVVEGAPPSDEGVFDWPLLKLNTRSGWSVKVSDKGQTALTRYKVLGRGAGTLIRSAYFFSNALSAELLVSTKRFRAALILVSSSAAGR
jgi:23S rRNA-/tRNA-specific pseudouridylate synthase